MKAAQSLRRSAEVLLGMVAVVEKAISERPYLQAECQGYPESMKLEAAELEAAARLLESMDLAAQAPAQPAEAVGTLSIQRFRGHLENVSFDYTGALPDGDYALYAHPAPSQPGRAVMQQALDALQTLLSMQAEWHAAFPEHVGEKEATAMQAARAAIAALSATMEVPCPATR